MSYAHLTQEERYQIYAFKKTGMNLSEIARELNRNRSTISREFNRNTGGKGYRPDQAQKLYKKRMSIAEKAIKLTDELKDKIAKKIRLDWSPEQVSGRLLKEEGISISHESIYQYILQDKSDGGELYTHLRIKKKRKKRYGTKPHDKRGQIKDKVSIDKRPQVVEEKSRKGDWEGDLVIGKNHKGALVTLVDRRTKKTKIGIVKSKEADIVSEAVSELMSQESCHTITFDNGKEFSKHKEMSKETGAKIYFAHPYSSWERGLNENTNGLIRQYFKKGSSFEGITDRDVKAAEERLNNRPRKCLGYLTPNEVYSGERRIIPTE